MGPVDPAIALSQVVLAQRSDPGEGVLEQMRESGGKGTEPILVALPSVPM